jgi:hypothetical protein
MGKRGKRRQVPAFSSLSLPSLSSSLGPTRSHDLLEIQISSLQICIFVEIFLTISLLPPSSDLQNKETPWLETLRNLHNLKLALQ